ncbi:hypothetical protein ACO0LF_03835 [Undibacterium sp. Di27W]|uniref:hypothetical protein n=1 Tax=Undibacterium sp. Di27W TaxID=3413036 RepID=UPI003BF2EC73
MSSKNSAFNKLPPFIWGEATSGESEDGFDQDEYLTHTRYPRFICRVREDRHTATGHDMEAQLVSAVGLMPDGFKELYVCQTHGVAMSDFVWLDPKPEPETLRKACDDAIINRLLRDDAMGLLGGNDED